MTKAYSQEQPEWVLAKYRNGSVYLGKKISEDHLNANVLLPTGDTITVNKDFAKHYYDDSNARIYRNGRFFRNNGFFWLLTFGTNAGEFSNSDDERISSHLGLHYGYRFTPKLSLSGGLAFEFNEARASGFRFDTQYTTLYAYGRYHLFTSKPQLFGFGRLGYGFAAEEQSENFPEEFEGGVNAMYGLGIIFASRSKSKFVLSLGHYFQKTKGQESFLDPIGNEVNTRFDLMMQRLILTFGWEIN